MTCGRIQIVSPAVFDRNSDSRLEQQAIAWGWNADFSAASSFFADNLTCASFMKASRSNENWSGFCDPEIDAEIAHAQSLSISDVPDAAKAWAGTDRDVVDQAPWIPLLVPRTLELTSSVWAITSTASGSEARSSTSSGPAGAT